MWDIPDIPAWVSDGLGISFLKKSIPGKINHCLLRAPLVVVPIICETFFLDLCSIFYRVGGKLLSRAAFLGLGGPGGGFKGDPEASS